MSTILRSPLLQSFRGVIHAFTTRLGGVSLSPFDSLNLSPKTGDSQGNVKKNIERLSEQLSIENTFFFLDQEHGDKILTVENTGATIDDRHFDAAISNSYEIPLVVITADCLPLLMYDPQRKAVGAVHAGWKGTASGIAEKTIKKMHDRFGCAASDIIVAMGPCIGACCYEVDGIVFNGFSQRGDPGIEEWNHSSKPVSKGEDKRWSFNIANANSLQLMRSGIKKENISLSPYCTCCRGDLFFSYRREGIKSGRQGAVIMMREDQTIYQPGSA